MRFIVAAAGLLLAVLSSHCVSRAGAAPGPRTILVAQSGTADVIGADSAALQRAAGMLRPGDTLSIGPGTYAMDDSLLVPSNVTVRGVPGQTVLRKNRGVESALVEDADYGDTFLRAADPQQFHAGMGVTISDDTLKSGWDVSVSRVAAVKLPYVILDAMTLRDYNAEHGHGTIRNTFP